MQSWIQVSEILRNFGLIIGGGIGIYLAWLRVTAANKQADAQRRQAEATARQAELGRHKLVTDLFLQAVGQLSDEKLEVRLFGIYTLRQIVDDYPRLQTSSRRVAQRLCPREPSEVGGQRATIGYPRDFQDPRSNSGERSVTTGFEEEQIELDLHGAFIRRTSLRRANLTRANLTLADCTGADFAGADFTDADLTGAILARADLSGANLLRTRLDGTDLRGAILTGARHLTRQQLDRAIVDDRTALPAFD